MNFKNNIINGEEIFKWANDLFPLNRSLTGSDNVRTLEYIKNVIPSLNIKYYRSGKKVFDWVVPEEWNVTEAFIKDECENDVLNFKNNNLHLVSYSEPVDKILTLDELKKHLYTLPDLPNAIPYRTSYYDRNWGFCISYDQYLKLKPTKYHVKIDSQFKKGKLVYGELLIQGKKKDEILISTYICHPSMGNNEISGIVLTMAIASYLSSLNSIEYSYRILFIPETIGSIAYLSSNYKKMKERTKAGLIVTCVGDNSDFSFLPSREGNTYADKVAKYALDNFISNYKSYSFLDRGSDERQYCSPLIDLPVVSIMRSKYGTYKEYHTSLDNLNFISKVGLQSSFDFYVKLIQLFELNKIYSPMILCEPQLGKRGLYNISSNDKSDILINALAYIDGKKDLMDLAELINEDIFKLSNTIKILINNKLIKEN